MQPLDAVTLKALGLEWREMLTQARVAKVMHPSAQEFLLTFWGGAVRGTHRDLLYIHLSPEAPCVFLADARQRQTLTLNTFDKPTALCMGLRKHLNGASFLTARTLPGERALDLVFENYNELGQRVRLVLSLELMGKHSNMILYDEAHGHMLAVAHGVSESMSRHRELAAGLPYAPPPFPSGKRVLSTLSEAEFTALWRRRPVGEPPATYLNRTLAGWGQGILKESLRIVLGPEAEAGAAVFEHDGNRLYHTLLRLEAGEALTPVVSANGERFMLLVPGVSSDLEGWRSCESVNALVADYFTRHLRAMRLRRRREQLLMLLDRRWERLQRREQELRPAGEDDAEEIALLQATGDRLLAAYGAGEVPREGPGGLREVRLTRYDSGEPWMIAIDPAVGWVENAQMYYRCAKKAKARQALQRNMAEPLRDALTFIENLRQLAVQADTLVELEAIAADLEGSGLALPGEGRSREEQERPPKRNGCPSPARRGVGGRREEDALPAGVVQFRSSDGLELLLGKSAQGNDAIVGRLSRADDVWLHVHQMPGSHVLIRAGKAPVPAQTLEEAARLAAYYSAARHSVNVPVIYTSIRYVRKIPHSYPGHVTYREEKTVFVTPAPI